MGINSLVHPGDFTDSVGRDATFSVNVNTTGTPRISYQWQQSANEGKNWWPVTDATDVILNLPGITADMDDNLYRCVVTVSDEGKKSSIVYTTGSGRLKVSQ